ncbi:unnamed protein product, partial [Rotaria magnacalcarata]
LQHLETRFIFVGGINPLIAGQFRVPQREV